MTTEFSLNLQSISIIFQCLVVSQSTGMLKII